MGTHAALCSIIRFLPYVETGEFANVGVVLFSPNARYFDFRLLTKLRRVTNFFDRLDRHAVADSIRSYRVEMRRISALVQEHFGSGSVAPKAARQLFDEVTRPRESVIRFSEPRAVMAAEPVAELDRLYEYFVERTFATPEYHEQMLERSMRAMLKGAGLAERFKEARIHAGPVEFRVPFAARSEGGDVIRVIKPLHLDQVDPIQIFDHGNQWAGRLRLLREKTRHSPQILLAVEAPQQTGDRFDAYRAVVKELEAVGAVIVSAASRDPILDFANAP